MRICVSVRQKKAARNKAERAGEKRKKGGKEEKNVRRRRVLFRVLDVFASLFHPETDIKVSSHNLSITKKRSDSPPKPP